MTAAQRRGVAAWVAILVPLWLALTLCAHWEPVVRDGWGHVRWHHWTGLSLGSLWESIVGGYEHNNPRLGQVVTILLYTPGPWHTLAQPLLELATFGLLATLVLGRRPSARSVDDALVFATTTALVVACVPIVGQILFYRPYTGNYLFGFALQLAFLVPYRMRGEGGAPASGGLAWRMPAMLLLGAAAGLCNEHTPPAVGAAALVAVIGCWRRTQVASGDAPPQPVDRRAGADAGSASSGSGSARRRAAGGRGELAWMLVGLVGLLAGWLALLYAPGQAYRYNALATQASTFERITDRGAGGGAWLVVKTLWYLGWAVPWLVLGVVARRSAGAGPMSRGRRVAIAAGLGAAVLAALTLLGSPKEGERLAFASCALAATAIASWVTAQIAPGWSRRVCAALAGLALVLVLGKCLLVLHEVSGEFDARMAAVLAAPKDSVITVDPYTVPRSRWFLGDDFVAANARQYVADTFGLLRIDYTGTTLPPAPPPAKMPP